nr:PREDICTED: craniofacial development protein 2-like [Bemisia tabaci]
MFFSGVSKDQRAQQGVAILVRNDLRKCITSWEPINERIVKMNVTVYGHKITLLGVYGINDDAPVAAKDQFFELLNDEILKVGTSREVIVLGDLNGRTGHRIDCKVVGPFGEDVVNDNGNRIIEVCEQNELKILNGFFQHRDIHKYTWVQRTRDLRSIIDYAITNQTTKIKVQQVKVCRGLSCGSDHHFLKVEIAFPVKSFPHSVHQQQQQQQGEKVQPVRYNIDSLHHQSVKDLYRKRLNEKLDEKQDFCDGVK